MNDQLKSDKERNRLAEAVRHALLVAALDAYEEGGLAGMCEEGRWELAIDAIKSLDLTQLSTLDPSTSSPPQPE